MAFQIKSGTPWSLSVRAQNADGKEAFTRLTVSPTTGCGEDQRCCTNEKPKDQRPPEEPAKSAPSALGRAQKCFTVLQ